MANPLAARFRTGTTLAMFTLVVFTLVTGTISSGSFTSAFNNEDAFGGGFKVRGATGSSVPITDMSAAIRTTPGLRASDFTAVGSQSVLAVDALVEGKPGRGHGAARLDSGETAIGAGIETSRAQLAHRTDGVRSERDERPPSVLCRAIEQRLRDLMSDADILSGSGAGGVIPAPMQGATWVGVGSLEGGFQWPGLRLVLVTDGEVFGRVKKRRRALAGPAGQTSSGAGPSSREVARVVSYQDLKIGDYVVHATHGIGK